MYDKTNNKLSHYTPTYLMSNNNIQKHRREYRPDRIFYLPLYIWYIWQAIRFRSRGWIIASNPGLTNAWLIGEDKRTALSQLDDSIKPKTVFRDNDEWVLSIDKKIIQSWIWYPCIAKADISRRSQKVMIVNTIEDLRTTIKQWRWNIIIQQYITNHEEFGISYARIPWQDSWQVLGIMHRVFAHIIGDWVRTLQQLISQHPRYHRYLSILQQQNQQQWNKVIPIWKQINIMPFGAHSRGTIFEDRSDKITDQITYHIDQAAQQIDWFYVGRFDIKAKSLDHLARGEFYILELNGVWWIPAHMYDPHYNIWQWWKILFRYRSTVVQVVKSSLQINNLKLPNIKQMYKIISCDQ